MEFSFDLCHGSFCEIDTPEKDKKEPIKNIIKEPIKEQPLSEPIDIPFTPPEINYLE